VRKLFISMLFGLFAAGIVGCASPPPPPPQRPPEVIEKSTTIEKSEPKEVLPGGWK
jgi:hypothetical protein